MMIENLVIIYRLGANCYIRIFLGSRFTTPIICKITLLRFTGGMLPCDDDFNFEVKIFIFSFFKSQNSSLHLQ